MTAPSRRPPSGARRLSKRTLLRCLIVVLTLILLILLAQYRSALFGAHRHMGQTDLLGYYSAARLIAEGHGGSLYDLHSLQNVAAFGELLVPRQVSALVTAAVSLIILLFLVWCARQTPTTDVPYGLAVIAALLISPHVLMHDLVLLLIPAAIALRCREMAPSASLILLAVGYVAVDLGGFLISFTHVEIAIIAIAAFGISLAVLADKTRPATPLILPVQREIPSELRQLGAQQ